MDQQQLKQRESQIQQEMSLLLVKIREANGIKNPFVVSQELGQSTSTLRNIEKGLAFPTVKTLNELIQLYVMTLMEKQKVIDLKNEMMKVRRELKSLRGRK